MGMYTDPNRIHSTDPGEVKGNPVFIYHEYFNDNVEEVKDLKDRYQKGKVGDIEVKEKLFIAIEKFLEPIREEREKIEKKGDDYIFDVLKTGEERAQKVAGEIEAKVMEVMGF